MKRVQFHLTEPQIEALQAKQKVSGVPVAEHVRRAVNVYLTGELEERLFAIEAELQALKEIKQRLIDLETFMREWRYEHTPGK